MALDDRPEITNTTISGTVLAMVSKSHDTGKNGEALDCREKFSRGQRKAHTLDRYELVTELF